MNEIEKRKAMIQSLIEDYYQKYEFLQSEPLDILIERTMKQFLNTNLSIVEINQELIRAIWERNISMSEDNDYYKDNQVTVEKEIEKTKQVPIQRVKYQEGGYVSKLSFIFFLLLIIVLLLIGFLLLNMK